MHAGIGVIRLALVLLLIGGCQPAPVVLLPADVIYHNAIVVTGTPGAVRAEAVAVRDGMIVAVGAAADVLRLGGDSTRLVDLGGATLLPGLFDNHVHAGIERGELMEWEGGWIAAVPAWIREARTIPELEAALRGEASRRPPGEWITGALSREVWPNQQLPTRHDLDRGAPDHPVLLTRGPHTTVLNSRALELAGIDRHTGFSGGGEIGHDADGEPDGRLYDAARRLASGAAPRPAAGELTEREAIDNLRRLMRQFAEMGLTSVNVAGVRPDELRYFQTLYQRHGDELPRAVVQIRLRPGFDAYDDLELSVRDAIAELEALGFVTGFGNDRLRIGAIKMSIDGGLSAPAYWSLEAYESKPDFTGVVRIPAEAFYPVARRAHELGWQLGIHTMGDAAVVMVVDELERILAESPRDDHRHYLHHVAVKPPRATIDKMAALGIGVASQPAFTVGLGAFAVESLAGAREATMNPTRSLLDAGIWMSWGSDGAPYGPRVALWTGITRKGWDGAVYGPEEAVDRAEALRLHTLGPAFQTFAEGRLGTIEPGKLADFTVFAENVLEIDADRIRHVPVLRTIVGGKDIWMAVP
ncbi:MAG: amidohydrolase [Gammaproteobacteria bacterium]|nr:amidohydrolase [Gammaproteobacteria bacterium]MDH4253147.1 amidohydrolase [Gammaproteobacteria bacterium]MDH5308491.1 amidohydrolase [Gammaproteobacteria bacterium]